MNTCSYDYFTLPFCSTGEYDPSVALSIGPLHTEILDREAAYIYLS